MPNIKCQDENNTVLVYEGAGHYTVENDDTRNGINTPLSLVRRGPTENEFGAEVYAGWWFDGVQWAGRTLAEVADDIRMGREEDDA